jgi:hypothetical protein
VRDTLPDFALTIGKTNLLLRETGSVRILFSTRIPVTNVIFTLEIPSDRLTGVHFAPRVAGAAVQFNATGSNSYSASVGMPGLSPLQGTVELGALSFTVVERTNSAIVSLDVTQLTGIRADGTRVGQTAANPGRVFIVISEPLLELFDFLGTRIYKLPGISGSIFSADPTITPFVWHRFADFVPRSTKVEEFNDPAFYPARIYRGVQPRLP